MKSFSTNAPVGQTSIQAPQNSHPDSIRETPLEVPIKLRPERLVKVNALSPRISLQTLTHLPQTIHRFISISHKGSLTSKGRFLLLYVNGVSKSISIYRTVSLSSHLSFLGQVTHLSFTETCLKQISLGPHKSILWQVKQP